MIDKIKQAIEEWMKQYHDITGWESDIAKAVLAAIQSSLPKPLPTRERMIEIIINNRDQTPGGLADAILHDGQIKIGDGWVDPKSGTTTYYVTRDFRAINEDTAFNRSFNFYPNNHYFLEKPHAEAFRDAEFAKLHKDEVQIGNGKRAKVGDKCFYAAWNLEDPYIMDTTLSDEGVREWYFLTRPEAVALMCSKGLIEIGNKKWVKNGTTGLWRAIRKDDGAKIVHLSHYSVDEKYPALDLCFLTESEAEDQLRKDGFVKVADGWVKGNFCPWGISEDSVWKRVVPAEQIDDDQRKRSYFSIDNAIEAFRKLAKETK